MRKVHGHVSYPRVSVSDAARRRLWLRPSAPRRPLRLGLVLILSSTMMAGCANLQRDRWLGADKFKHFAAGAAIGAGAGYAARESGASRDDARTVGITLAFAAGAGKELYDQEIKHGPWSWQDLTWTVLGGLLGSLLVGEGD